METMPQAGARRAWLAAAVLGLATVAIASTTCSHGPCYPGNEQCAAPPPAGVSPRFHMIDQHGCGLGW